MQKITAILSIFIVLTACSMGKKENNSENTASESVPKVSFSADSAYHYVKKQVDFGPRVPNTEAHTRTAQWLVSELSRHGAKVTEQKADLKAFDGTVLHAVNIIGQYNPNSPDRILLLAHYDTRPWADEDPDPAKHKMPIPGANDGASGVGVLLEIARQLNANNPNVGVDILFVDAEDWGSHDDDDSWALGTKYFAENPFIPGYSPSHAILLDMVGGRGSCFYREHFSQQAAPQIIDKVWAHAADAGFSDRFINSLGGAVTDDHVPLINAGIPAIDIIGFEPNEGFPSTWHTMADDMNDIDPETLRVVGQTLLNYLLAQ